MIYIHLLALVATAILLCACAREAPVSSNAASPVETPTALAIVVATHIPTPEPTIPPSPLEATLVASATEYADASGTVPATVVNGLIASYSSTQTAHENATQAAWAALPLNIGTPTVPAPRDDGLNPDDPGSWARYIDPTGFSFDYLVSQDILYAEPTSLPQAVGGSGVTTRFKNGEMIRGANEAIGFSVFRGENPFITEKSFPANMASPQGEPHFAVKFDFIGATHAWMYLFGDQNTSPNPVNMDYWNYGPQLYVHLYNEDCKADIQFSGSVNGAGPIEDLLTTPLNQVVAEHFPVLDHMYRSVQFPPECSAPASP